MNHFLKKMMTVVPLCHDLSHKQFVKAFCSPHLVLDVFWFCMGLKPTPEADTWSCPVPCSVTPNLTKPKFETHLWSDTHSYIFALLHPLLLTRIMHYIRYDVSLLVLRCVSVIEHKWTDDTHPFTPVSVMHLQGVQLTASDFVTTCVTSAGR